MRAHAAGGGPTTSTGQRRTAAARPSPAPIPGRLGPGDLLRLQRSAGNGAVAQLLEETGTPAPAPPTFPIYDSLSHQKKMVDAEAYEKERAALGRRLRFFAKAIPEDAAEVLKEYPFTDVKDMYTESLEAFQHAAQHYAKGDLLLAGMWAREASHYTDIESKAHKIFMDTGMFSYVGKRVGLAVVGFFEGAADAALGLIDAGAGLVGAHPGLVEWNTKQYDKIKGGYGELTGIDHTLVHDDEIGRFGGKIAGGAAFGGAIAKAAQGGSAAAQLLLLTQVGGGINAAIESIRTLRAGGKSWGEIVSDPTVVAQVAGAVVGAAGLGASVAPGLQGFFTQAGLVATAAQMSGLTATVVKIQMDPSLSDEEKYRRTLDATANLIVAVGLTADSMYGPRPAAPAAAPRPPVPEAVPGPRPAGPEPVTPAGSAAKPAPKPAARPADVHERFDVSDVTPEPAPAGPTPSRPGGMPRRSGPGKPGDPSLTVGDKATTTTPAPHDPAAVADIGEHVAPPPSAPKSTAAHLTAAEAGQEAARAVTAREAVRSAHDEVTAVVDRHRAGGRGTEVAKRTQSAVQKLREQAEAFARRAESHAEEAKAAAAKGDRDGEHSAARAARYNAGRAASAARDATRLALAAQLDGVNPTGSMDNCGHVIEAVEARVRGTNPDAQARPEGNLYATTRVRGGGTRYKESLGDQYDSHFDASTEAGIARDLAARGEGAQGVVFVEWLKADGTAHDVGHFFNAVNKNGTTFYLDGQTGRVETSIGALFPGHRVGAIEYMPIRR